MLRISVDDRGAFLAIAAAAARLEKGIDRELLGVARLAAADIQQDLQGARTGRIYRSGGTLKRSHRRRGRVIGTDTVAVPAVHQASSPGERPAIYTGRLYRSLQAKRSRRYKATAYVLAAIAQAPHAHLAEYGTKHRTTRKGKSTGRVAPRPFLYRRADYYEALAAESVLGFVEEIAAQVEAGRIGGADQARAVLDAIRARR